MKTSEILTSCALALTSITSCCNAAALHQAHYPTQQSNISLDNALEEAIPIPFSPCKGFDKASARFSVHEIALSPNPPVRGQDLDIVIKGDLHEEMGEGAFVKVSIEKIGIVFAELKFDWCKNIHGLACPVQPGNVTFSKTQNIDAKIPIMSFTLVVGTFNKANEQISCVRLKSKVSKPAAQLPGLEES